MSRYKYRSLAHRLFSQAVAYQLVAAINVGNEMFFAVKQTGTCLAVWKVDIVLLGNTSYIVVAVT